MGSSLTDGFSVLHFLSGIFARFLGLDKITWLIIHVVFELAENSPWGMKLINMMPYWPGGKDHADNWTNMIGDTFYAMLGHYVAYMLGEAWIVVLLWVLPILCG